MKKRISCITALIVSLVCLCSCSKGGIDSPEASPFGENLNWVGTSESQTIVAETQQEEAYVVHYDDVANYEYPTYNEIKEKYPNKTVLVWVFEGTGYDYAPP